MLHLVSLPVKHAKRYRVKLLLLVSCCISFYAVLFHTFHLQLLLGICMLMCLQLGLLHGGPTEDRWLPFLIRIPCLSKRRNKSGVRPATANWLSSSIRGGCPWRCRNPRLEARAIWAGLLGSGPGVGGQHGWLLCEFNVSLHSRGLWLGRGPAG